MPTEYFQPEINSFTPLMKKMKLKYLKLFEWIFNVFYLGKGFVLSLFWHPNILGGAMKSNGIIGPWYEGLC